MKGTFFQRPLEFNLFVDGEAWNQGDAIKGTLRIRNHGSEALPLDEVKVQLGHGSLRLVRQKSADAFDILATAPVAFNGPLAAGQDTTVAWSFQTDRNSPITDNTSSLFLLYGKGSSPEQLGQLQVAMKPFPLIDEFLDTFLTQFRFVVKSKKDSKGGVAATLDPPDSQAFSTLDQLVVHFKFKDETLELKYTYRVKKIEATSGSIDVKKKDKTYTQSLEAKQYRLPSGRVNHEAFENAIREAIAQADVKSAF